VLVGMQAGWFRTGFFTIHNPALVFISAQVHGLEFSLVF
jgi:hypothetical protein